MDRKREQSKKESNKSSSGASKSKNSLSQADALNLAAINQIFGAHAMSPQGQEQNFDNIPIGDLFAEMEALHARGEITDKTDLSVVLSKLQIAPGNLGVAEQTSAEVSQNIMAADGGGKQKASSSPDEQQRSAESQVSPKIQSMAQSPVRNRQKNAAKASTQKASASQNKGKLSKPRTNKKKKGGPRR